jgi:transcriptional regulator with PAS, ATPase and Fis domain
LLESELFGYERGAFTGAHATKPGQLQLADGGTVFLDEVADLGAQGQAKILRAIESGQLSRLGSQQTHPVDLRVIAATNQDVERAVEQGRFRKDLYFRLNVARVHLPPLRDRHGDLRTLLEHYIQMQNRRLSTNLEGVTDETLDALAGYDWPGNVRELKNAVESVFVSRVSGRASLEDFPDLLQRRLAEIGGRRPAERDRLLSALAETRWNVTRTAEKLRWSRMTIYRKIAKYNLPKPTLD